MEWAILLLLAGLMLVVAEVFFPSFGLLSVLAAACFLGSLIFAFRESSTLGFSFLGGIVVSVPVLVIGGFRVLPKTSIGKRLILSGPEADEVEIPSSMLLNQELLESTGETLTPLRPSGIADIGGKRVDVLSDGEMIGPNEKIRVILVEGNRIVVERVE